MKTPPSSSRVDSLIHKYTTTPKRNNVKEIRELEAYLEAIGTVVGLTVQVANRVKKVQELVHSYSVAKKSGSESINGGLLAPYESNWCTVTEVPPPSSNPIGESSIHDRRWGGADFKISAATALFQRGKTRSFRVIGEDWMGRGVEILGHKIGYCRDGVLMSDTGVLLGSYENITEKGHRIGRIMHIDERGQRIEGPMHITDSSIPQSIVSKQNPDNSQREITDIQILQMLTEGGSIEYFYLSGGVVLKNINGTGQSIKIGSFLDLRKKEMIEEGENHTSRKMQVYHIKK